MSSVSVHEQVITETMGEKYLAMKLKDQERSIAMLAADPDLKELRQIQAPLVDLEVRGLPALAYFGGQMWKDTLPEMSAGALLLTGNTYICGCKEIGPRA